MQGVYVKLPKHVTHSDPNILSVHFLIPSNWKYLLIS